MASGSPQRPPLPKYSPKHSPKRGHVRSKNARLSVIVEDSAIPPIPPGTHNRPFSRRWNLGEPPRHSFEKPPPKYSVWDVTGPKGEKLVDVRNNKYIASRGGWKRICIILWVLTAIVLALCLGLIMGLRKKSSKSTNESLASNSSSSSPSPSPSSDTAGPFPAGSYTFTTFLDQITTNCTSVSTYWQCLPSVTYHDSPSASPSIYQWIINNSSSDPSSNFTISSSSSPFGIIFNDEPLTVLDVNMESERYAFSLTYDRVIIPSLGVQCSFANTKFAANLYTKRPKSYPEPLSPSSEPKPRNPSLTPFQDWEFAVDVTQSVGGGSTIPTCYHTKNGVTGAKITDGITPADINDVCTCVYKNYDPS